MKGILKIWLVERLCQLELRNTDGLGILLTVLYGAQLQLPGETRPSHCYEAFELAKDKKAAPFSYVTGSCCRFSSTALCEISNVVGFFRDETRGS